MSTHLDQGNPAALYCRHCQSRKEEGPRGGLFCGQCDGSALTIARASTKDGGAS